MTHAITPDGGTTIEKCAAMLAGDLDGLRRRVSHPQMKPKRRKEPQPNSAEKTLAHANVDADCQTTQPMPEPKVPPKVSANWRNGTVERLPKEGAYGFIVLERSIKGKDGKPMVVFVPPKLRQQFGETFVEGVDCKVRCKLIERRLVATHLKFD